MSRSFTPITAIAPDDGGDAEHGEPHKKKPTFALEAPAAQEQEAAEGEGEAVEDPLRVGAREPQLPPYRGEKCADDGGVGHRYKGSGAQQEERRTPAPHGCLGASSLSHTARQVSSRSSVTANSKSFRATLALARASGEVRLDAPTASRRSSASASIWAFLSRASSTVHQSCMSPTFLSRLPCKGTEQTGHDPS